MLYRDFGKTGVKISALGFGSMRFPMKIIDGKNMVDEEKAIPVIRKAYDLGVNYFDSAYFYCEGQSENVLGKALKDVRDKVYISTKFPFWNKTDRTEFRRILEEQLMRLGGNCIDFYHLHDMSKEAYNNTILKYGFLEEAFKAKDEGLIKHLSFSSHDKPDAMKYLIDTGCFETLLCQYNLIDRVNKENMAYARGKGIGVVVMGPVGGGRISGLPPEIVQKLGIKVKNSSELALRFVFSNPNIDCAISGMSTVEMVEENAAIASRSNEPLKEAEINSINGLMDKYRKLSELYCTGCNYCMPCPQGINIPYIFSLMNYYKIYDIREYAKSSYAYIGSSMMPGYKKADACIKCGICEDKCPQKIKIRDQLKDCGAVLGKKL